LAQRTGHGRIEGCNTPVSIETVERIACTTGTITITFDETGQPINLGREQRLYTHHQRIALAARDGGCRWPNCDRPPGGSEAHHIRHWKRDHGETNLPDGLLLCRHHHLLLHNNHWEIRRENSDYWLIPPPDIDPAQVPRLMPSKSAALRDLQCDLQCDLQRERQHELQQEQLREHPREPQHDQPRSAGHGHAHEHEHEQHQDTAAS
jgi:hypothetical protein